jgi:hypothetical protein
MRKEKSKAITKVEADFDDGHICFYIQVNEKYYDEESGNLMIKRISTNSHFTDMEKVKIEHYFHTINHSSYKVYDNTIIVYP